MVVELVVVVLEAAVVVVAAGELSESLLSPKRFELTRRTAAHSEAEYDFLTAGLMMRASATDRESASELGFMSRMSSPSVRMRRRRLLSTPERQGEFRVEYAAA